MKKNKKHRTIAENKLLEDKVEYEKEENDLSDDELPLQSTKDPKSLKDARKKHLKEKREFQEKNKPKDEKIKIVAQDDHTELLKEHNLVQGEDSDTDADEDTVVNRLTLAKKLLRKKDKHQAIEDS